MMHIKSILYAHGLGGSPSSAKAVLVRERFEPLGVVVEAPSLAVPSLERLSPLAARNYLLERIRALSSDTLVVVASSFGAFLALHALTALQADTRSAPDRIVRLVLLAPVFDPWHSGSALLSPQVLSRWREQGRLPVTDLARGVEVDVHYRFVEELQQLGVAPVIAGVPTLIVHGVRDEVVSVEQSRAYAAQSSCVQLVEVDDDHSLLNRSSDLLSCIDRFLGVNSGL